MMLAADAESGSGPQHDSEEGLLHRLARVISGLSLPSPSRNLGSAPVSVAEDNKCVDSLALA